MTKKSDVSITVKLPGAVALKKSNGINWGGREERSRGGLTHTEKQEPQAHIHPPVAEGN